MRLRLEQSGDDVLLAVKAVPGASRDAVAGILGDRLKVRISAPAEGGKANDAIRNLLAAALDRRPRDVTIEAGHTHQEKTIRIANATASDIRAMLRS